MYRFRECREQARLTQKYVALSLGVSSPSVSDWEKGNTKPTIENLIALANLYRVSVDYLLGVSDVPVRGIVIDVKPREDIAQEETKNTSDETRLLAIVQRLNSLGVEKVIEYAADLADNEKYTQEASGASAI